MISIREIQPGDNAALASIIRQALRDFDAVREKTVYYDESTDHLYDLFRQPGSVYFVAEENGQLLGGAGLFPTTELPEGMVELVKMYLSSAARGRGLGARLMETCLQRAKELGYQTVYLESLPELKPAIKLYEKTGFNYLDQALGDPGHAGCSIWMKKDL